MQLVTPGSSLGEMQRQPVRLLVRTCNECASIPLPSAPQAQPQHAAVLIGQRDPAPESALMLLWDQQLSAHVSFSLVREARSSLGGEPGLRLCVAARW